MMKGSVTRALFHWAVGLLLIGVVGLLISNQWYADDVCGIEEWKCELGDLGWNATFYLLPLGALFALIASVTWVVGVLSKEA